MELLRPLVVQKICLLHHEVLDGAVGIRFGESITRDVANNLLGKITYDQPILVLLSHNLVHGEGCLQLPEPEFQVLNIERWDRELQVQCWGHSVDIGTRRAGAGVAPAPLVTREEGLFLVTSAVCKLMA